MFDLTPPVSADNEVERSHGECDAFRVSRGVLGHVIQDLLPVNYDGEAEHSGILIGEHVNLQSHT